MKVQLNRRILVRGAAIVTLATAIIAASPVQPAFAQSGDNDQVIVTEIHGPDQNFLEEGFVDSMVLSDGYISDEKLMANALGLSEEELEEAYAQAFGLALEQAVADGDLTQAQADDLKESEHGPFMMEGMLTDDEIDQFLAQALDMTPESFQEAMDGAIQKAADDGLITQAQANDMLLEKLIEDRLEEAYSQALDEAVTQGLITQSQADTMKEESRHGFGHDEEIIMMDPFGQEEHFQDFDFQFGPGDIDINEFFFHGPGDFDFENEFEEFEFFEGPGRSGRWQFRFPNFEHSR